MEAYNIASQFAANEGARVRNEAALSANNAAAISAQAYRDKLAADRQFGGGGGGGSRQVSGGSSQNSNSSGISVQQARELQTIQDRSENFRANAKLNRDIEIMDRQASIDAQAREKEAQRASESGRSQRESNERIAAMNAQSQSLGGLFGSIGQRQQSNFWS
jgi:hypothetical protein